MATIKKRNEKYVVIYDYIDEEGKRKQKWKTCTSKKEAILFKADIETSKVKNSFITPSDKMLKDFLEEWVQVYSKGNWQCGQYTGVKSAINNHINPHIGDMKLQNITTYDIEKLYAQLRSKKVGESVSYLKDKDSRRNLSSTTIRGVHSILKTALSKAVDWQLIAVNPVPRKGPRKCKPEFPIWTAAQIRLALENMDHELLHLVIHLAFLTSARVGEICGLTWDCVDFEAKTILINKTLQRAEKEAIDTLSSDGIIKVFSQQEGQTKTSLILKKPKTRTSVRTLYISDELEKELSIRFEQIAKEKVYYGDQREDFNLVFAQETGFPLEPRIVGKWFRKWQDDNTHLNLPYLRFHDIRHSSCTFKTGGQRR